MKVNNTIYEEELKKRYIPSWNLPHFANRALKLLLQACHLYLFRLSSGPIE
jgi:hypothetical protein